MNPGAGPDVAMDDPCMTCDDKGYVTTGRDWQTEPCPDCTRQSRADHEADKGDAARDCE